MSLRIRSDAIALASSGGPNNTRLNVWPKRPAAVGGASSAVVVRIGGNRPSRPATGTNLVKRPGRNSLAVGYLPRAGSTGNAFRHTDGPAVDRPQACPTSRRAASSLSFRTGNSASGRGEPA